MNRMIAVSLMMLLGIVPAKASPMPISAEIVDVPEERRDSGYHIGNIQVKFEDGRTEMWTKLGRCLIVRRAASGLVGWTHYTSRNSYGEPVNSVLRVMCTSQDWKDFQADPNFPFIEDWGFANEVTDVIVKSRGRHGPSLIQRFSLTTGELIDSTKGSDFYANTPEWAKPFTDDKPDKIDGEQGGAGQPATHPVVEPEGGD